MNLAFLPQINDSKCIGCELCVRGCPNHALALINDIAVVVHPNLCNYTGICQEICPTEAISLVYEIVFSRKEEDMPNVP
jgi:Pyruvate/2-oxoacid:ferredoxin oxidoreductase delta subunit